MGELSRRQEMHQWFAYRQRAVAGDLAAADNYERLAAICTAHGDTDMAAYRMEQAAGARASAESWRAEMALRMGGRWRKPHSRASKTLAAADEGTVEVARG